MLLTINQLEVKYGKQTALRITEPLSFDRANVSALSAPTVPAKALL